jgi:hypothetical protein
MQTVIVHRDRLRQALTENRLRHETNWKEAHARWRVDLADQLTWAAVELADGGKVNLAGILKEHQEPENHTEDYDRVLAMLDFSDTDQITLTQGDFRNYVLDEWDWKTRWNLSNAKYLG